VPGESMKEFDHETLKQFDGQDGKPIYIAHRNLVIDVSTSKFWKTGMHMKRHPAGNDLTAEIEAAPHGREVLDRYPQVGILKEKEEAGRPLPGRLGELLDRFPLLRRHPHPMFVHFPIVFMFAPALFLLLFLFTGLKSFETTALHCLGAGIFFLPFAVLTGFFSWWLNYQAKPSRPIRMKIRLSILLLALSVGTFVWRLMVPDILSRLTGWGGLYLFLIFSFLPVVTAIGWFGAQMTFPLEKNRA
jgi:predicted heme/steroid binding protein/uncharacterized membrane protein